MMKKLIFRYRENSYINKQGAIINERKAIPLKRISTPKGYDGEKPVPEVFWLIENLQEDISFNETTPKFPEGIKDGELMIITYDIESEGDYGEITYPVDFRFEKYDQESTQ
jgi:hypothetical protein